MKCNQLYLKNKAITSLRATIKEQDDEIAELKAKNEVGIGVLTRELKDRDDKIVELKARNVDEINRSNNALKRQYDGITSLQIRSEQSESRNVELQASLQESNTKIVELKAKHEAGMKHTARLAATLKGRDDEIAELEAKLELCSELKRSEIFTLENILEDRKKVVKLQTTLKIKDDEIVILKAKLTGLEASNGTLNMASSSLQTRYESSVNLVARLESTLNERGFEIIKWKSTLNVRDDKIAELEFKLKGRDDGKITALESKNEALTKCTDGLVDRLVGREYEITALKAKHEVSIRRNTQLGTTLRGRSEEITELETQLDSAKIAAEVADNALKYRDDAIVKLTAKLIGLETSNGTLNMAGSSLQTRYQSAIDRISELESEIAQRSRTYRELEKQAESLRETINRISKQLESDWYVDIVELRKELADQVTFSAAKIHMLETTQADLLDRLNRKSTRISELHSEIARLLKIIVKLSEENKELKKNKTDDSKLLRLNTKTLSQMRRTIEVQEQIDAMDLKLAKADFEANSEKIQRVQEQINELPCQE